MTTRAQAQREVQPHSLENEENSFKFKLNLNSFKVQEWSLSILFMLMHSSFYCHLGTLCLENS